MKRVTGIGGIFIKSDDPERLITWYKRHLGMNIETLGRHGPPLDHGGTPVNPTVGNTHFRERFQSRHQEYFESGARE